MNQSDPFVLHEVRRIFREVFEEPDMPMELSTSRDHISEWDSVVQVKLVLAMEDAFQIEFSTDDVASIQTVGGFVEAVERRRA